ncbi:MAG: bifunctional oligoribonuclease/PAP phosphatase NrnA [Patescibacteria group bacterium]
MSIDRSLLQRFASWVSSAQRVLLVAHERPDGDGISSALAMRQALRQLGKVADCVSRDPIPATFQFLPEANTFVRDFFIGDYDTIITFDCGDARRTGFDDRFRVFAHTRRRLINIDHHPKNDLHRVANMNLIDPGAAATAQIVYEIFGSQGWPINHSIATCLLCGLHTDTGGFKHPNTTPRVLKIASDLLARGGRLKDITRHLVNARSVPMLRLWGLVLNRLRQRVDLGIVSSMVTLEDLKQCQATHDDVAGVVNLIKNIPKTKVAILFIEETDGSIRASLRTDAEGVDVARLAALFGGGGLKKAGGFSITAHLHSTQNHWDIVWQ